MSFTSEISRFSINLPRTILKDLKTEGAIIDKQIWEQGIGKLPLLGCIRLTKDSEDFVTISIQVHDPLNYLNDSKVNDVSLVETSAQTVQSSVLPYIDCFSQTAVSLYQDESTQTRVLSFKDQSQQIVVSSSEKGIEAKCISYDNEVQTELVNKNAFVQASPVVCVGHCQTDEKKYVNNFCQSLYNQKDNFSQTNEIQKDNFSQTNETEYIESELQTDPVKIIDPDTQVDISCETSSMIFIDPFVLKPELTNDSTKLYSNNPYRVLFESVEKALSENIDSFEFEVEKLYSILKKSSFIDKNKKVNNSPKKTTSVGLMAEKRKADVHDLNFSQIEDHLLSNENDLDMFHSLQSSELDSTTAYYDNSELHMNNFINKFSQTDSMKITINGVTYIGEDIDSFVLYDSFKKKSKNNLNFYTPDKMSLLNNVMKKEIPFASGLDEDLPLIIKKPRLSENNDLKYKLFSNKYVKKEKQIERKYELKSDGTFSQDRRFNCPYCPDVFSLAEDLYQHLFSLHRVPGMNRMPNKSTKHSIIHENLNDSVSEIYGPDTKIIALSPPNVPSNNSTRSAFSSTVTPMSSSQSMTSSLSSSLSTIDYNVEISPLIIQNNANFTEKKNSDDECEEIEILIEFTDDATSPSIVNSNITEIYENSESNEYTSLKQYQSRVSDSIFNNHNLILSKSSDKINVDASSHVMEIEMPVNNLVNELNQTLFNKPHNLSKKSFPCPRCSKSFAKSSALYIHLQSCNGDEK